MRGAKKRGTLLRFGLFSEYIDLEYVPMHGMYRANQAGYSIRILVVVPQEYVDTDSTRRVAAPTKKTNIL